MLTADATAVLTTNAAAVLATNAASMLTTNAAAVLTTNATAVLAIQAATGGVRYDIRRCCINGVWISCCVSNELDQAS